MDQPPPTIPSESVTDNPQTSIQRCGRQILADDTSQSASPASSQQSHGSKKSCAADKSSRTRMRKGRIARKRASHVEISETQIMKWAVSESLTDPQHVLELGRKLVSMVPSDSTPVPSTDSTVELISWRDVAQTTLSQSHLNDPSLSGPKQRIRLNQFSNPGESVRVSVAKVVHDDSESDSPQKEEQVETVTKDEELQKSQPKEVFSTTLFERHSSSDDKLESLSIDEPSPFLTSEIDSELSQDLNSIKVPISVPLKTKFVPPPVSSTAELYEPVVNVTAIQPLTHNLGVTPSDNSHDNIAVATIEDTTSTTQAQTKSGSLSPSSTRWTGKPRVNTLLLRLQERHSTSKKDC